MNARLRESVAALALRTGISPLAARLLGRRRVGILLYHDPSPEVMRAHLEHLSRRHAVVPLERVVDAIERGDLSSLPPHPIVLTLDDGHRGNARLADVLERQGARATIYVCSAIVATRRRYWFGLAGLDPEPLKRMTERARLTWLRERHGFDPLDEAGTREALNLEELRELGRVASFGAHTRTHPILPACDDESARTEISGSKHELEQLLGMPCHDFAYPNGSYGERDLKLVREAGYRSARTTDLGWNGRGADAYRLRVLTRGADTMSVPLLALHLAGIGVLKARLLRLRKSA